MLVLSMSDPAAIRDESGDDTIQSTWAAMREGLPVHHLPLRFDEAEVPRLLDGIAPDRPTVGVITGHILPFSVYETLHRELERRGVRLVNDPTEHRTCFELDLALPLLGELTPKTFVMRSLEDADAAAEAIGFPAFLKGALLSSKHLGWKSCVAEDVAGLRKTARRLFDDGYRSRGRVLVRELVPLRKTIVAALDFPPAREYRVFLYEGHVVGWGFYWPWFLDFADLSAEEERAMLDTARRAADVMPTPFLSVDVGQLENGEWIVIEVGDPQFSGRSLIDARPMWRRLRELIGR